MGHNLHGKTMLVTQEKKKALKQVDFLRKQGAEADILPMIKIQTLEPGRNEIEIINSLDKFDLIIFTSKNGVNSFFQIYSAFNKMTILKASAHFAVIGGPTAEALQKLGYEPSYINPGNTSKDFWHYLKADVVPHHSSALLVLGNLAPDFLKDELSQMLFVQRMNVYETVQPQYFDDSICKKVRLMKYDMITFTSPSAFFNFQKLFNFNPEDIHFKIASIGKVTSSAIKNHGFHVDVTAKKSSIEGLCNEIVNYYTLKRYIMNFPITRLRRLRNNPVIRNMVNETVVSIDNLVMPLFVCPGENVKNEIKSMPGNYQFSIDKLVEECLELYGYGVSSVLLFGIPETKDEHGLVAAEENSIVAKAIRAIKEKVAPMYVIADICNCEYTTHGHCGTIVDGDVDNDITLETLAKQAVTFAKAGVDMVAPSDMMDGRVGRIREALDEYKFTKVPIMSYAAKFASAFYGPFRDAADSAPQFGDRKTYQMNPANSNEAMREIKLDIYEGADIVMVKPALSYLDIIRRAKDEFNIPIAAYNVSGEFSMVKAAAEKGWIDEERIVKEILMSIRRAGADIILTYHTKYIAKLLDGKKFF